MTNSDLSEMLICSAGTFAAQTAMNSYADVRDFSNWCYLNREELPGVQCVFERIRCCFALFTEQLPSDQEISHEALQL